MVDQGDVYWVDLGDPQGSEPGFRRPYVVIQNNTYNHSAINTVIVCALTSNIRRAEVPGNVLLDEGEAGLPKSSVVLVTQLFTVDKRDLVEKIGAVSPGRVRQILNGLSGVLTPE
ncbi:MAG: type II toxin-antitoxin system PemK/MazF family toxin [Chloroflexota bacterium]|jgi:mRNA interferase MazF